MKRILRLIVSILLVYFAFKKINVISLINGLTNVPVVLIFFTLFSSFLLTMVSGYRWSTILLKNPKITDVLVFVKCSYLASFYGLFLPTSMGSDLVKWLPLIKKYPDLNKIKIAGSVLIDRIIGASAFFPVAFIFAILGKIIGFNFPWFLILVSGSGCILVLVFYLILFLFDFERYFERFKFFKKIIKVMDLIKKENKNILLKAFFISIILNIFNLIPIWITSIFLGANFSLISIYVFLPIISLILILPISIAGFGAREQLYLFFFSQLGIGNEKILLVSTYQGIMGVIMALLSGIFMFIDNRSKVINKK